MTSLPTLPTRTTELQQLSMALDAPKLRGLSPTERGAVLGALAGLLLEASNNTAREDDDARV